MKKFLGWTLISLFVLVFIAADSIKYGWPMALGIAIATAILSAVFILALYLISE